MNAADLIVLSPADGRPRGLCATEWPAELAPDPYDCRAAYEQGGKPWRVFGYTYPGGPESHAYLVVPADIPAAEFLPGARYHGARKAGPLRAVPVATLTRSRRSRLVIPGATEEDHAEVLAQLMQKPAPDHAPAPKGEPDQPEEQEQEPPKLKRGGR